MTTTVDIKNKEELDQLLDQLRDARTHAAGLRAEKKAMIDAVQATSEFRALDGASTEADQTIEALEQEIRDAGVTFKVEGKDIPDRIEVKTDTKIEIPDELAAKTWCLENFTPALKLDTKTFNDAVKKNQVPPTIAQKIVGWKTHIATKL